MWDPLRWSLGRLVLRAGGSVKYEQAIPGDTDRPADLLIEAPWLPSKTAVDVSVVHKALAQTTTASASSAKQRQALAKVAHYRERCKKAGWHFIPFICDTAGGLHTQAVSFLKRIAQAIAERTGERYPAVCGFVRGMTSCSIAKGVVSQLQHCLYASQRLQAQAPDGCRELPWDGRNIERVHRAFGDMPLLTPFDPAISPDLCLDANAL